MEQIQEIKPIIDVKSKQEDGKIDGEGVGEACPGDGWFDCPTIRDCHEAAIHCEDQMELQKFDN